jgi:putative ABC transport system permease protein
MEPKKAHPLARNSNRVMLAKALGPYFSGSENPVGSSIHVNNQSFFIESSFTSTDKLLGIDWQRAILAPFKDYGERRPEDEMRMIVYFPQKMPPDAPALLESSLMRIRNNKDFYVHNFEAMLENKRKIIDSIKLLTESISLIVLLMASVSCMNIFFVAVNERTREIGLRRALGATKLEIIFLVMRDCYIFMAIGTILGLIGGYFFTQHLMRPLLLVMPEFSGWKFDAYSQAIGKTLLFVLISSSLSGLFPALRAASVDPAVALRE